MLKLSHIRWFFPLLFLYVFAGTFQYFGIFSQTQSNFIVLVLLVHVFHFYSSWTEMRLEMLLILFMIFVLIYQVSFDFRFEYSLTYIYYIVCTIIASVAGRVYAKRFFLHETYNTLLFKIAKIFLVFQCLFTLIQANFTESYVSFSKASIGYEDAIFGTLYLQSDAALATVCELIILSVFILPSTLRDKILITCLSLFVIFLGNSKTAQFVVIFILFTLLLRFLLDNLKNYRLSLKIIIGLIGIFTFVITSSIWLGYLDFFIQQAISDFDRKDEWITAPRFAPLGEIFQSGINFFGQGPLTYYNPIEKTWLYNSGFSTLYILYFDYGLLGFLLYFLYQFYLILKFGIDFSSKIIYFMILMSYMNFNFALTDISFIFMFNFTLLLLYRFNKSQISTLEKPYVSKN